MAKTVKMARKVIRVTRVKPVQQVPTAKTVLMV